MPRLVVNGRPLEFRTDPQIPLLWALRDAANLTGTKYGCGSGECGACTVLLDGAAQPSCMISLAECEGRSVVTIEGLAALGLGAIPEALVEAQAIQCGFCTPGIAMQAAALLSRNAGASVTDIAPAIEAICRCGMQPRIAAAIAAAGTRLRSATQGALPPAPGPSPHTGDNP